MSNKQNDTFFEAQKDLEKCDHVCSSNCRHEGCNCGCGEFHDDTAEIFMDLCVTCFLPFYDCICTNKNK